MPKTELYGSASCQFTREMREWLEWKNREFEEYDVDADPDALARMLAVTGGQRMVPVLVEDGKATQIGWQGRGCLVGKAPNSSRD
jgi:glutaredoxin 3